MDGLIVTPPESKRVLAFNIINDPIAAQGAAEFTNGSEEGTIRFLDFVLPHCERMIDLGAYIGFTALHAASRGVAVHAFEPNPVSHDLLVRNVAANPALSPAMRLHQHGIGARDARVMLYVKACADSGASIHQTIERSSLIQGMPLEEIRLRAAETVLGEIGVDQRTLIKMDIEGAEYEVLPAIAPLLALARPWLHVSFHPFNLVDERGAWHTELLRLRAMLDVAEALSCYRYTHVFSHGAWDTIGAGERMDFLRHYLMRAKPLPRIRTPQYGFVDAIGFSDQPLPGGE